MPVVTYTENLHMHVMVVVVVVDVMLIRYSWYGNFTSGFDRGSGSMVVYLVETKAV